MFICYIKPYGIDLFQFISFKYLGDENEFCQREIPWCTMHSCRKNERKSSDGFGIFCESFSITLRINFSHDVA